MNSLLSQVKEFQKQTKEMAKQIKFLFWLLIITIIGIIFNIIFKKTIYSIIITSPSLNALNNILFFM
jgi:FtsH-binding integral membrane protein